jgi:uncharacterized Zn finger protein
MAWYGNGDWEFRPYVSVAQRRANAARELARLTTKKNGRKPEPVVLGHRRRQIAATFWGKAWCDNLERYADLANRLPRGRSYIRNGSVVDLSITKGKVEARVAGSQLYTVEIGIAPMARARWRQVVARCTGKIASLVGLLRGELSADVMAVLVDGTHGLFPAPREIEMDCSCPDWAGVCKHIAAVLYGVGTRLDEKPELFFVLRQVDQAELLSSATSGAISRHRAGRGTEGGTRIAASKLADVFGIEIVDEPASRAKPRVKGRPTPSRLRRRAGDGQRTGAS